MKNIYHLICKKKFLFFFILLFINIPDITYSQPAHIRGYIEGERIISEDVYPEPIVVTEHSIYGVDFVPFFLSGYHKIWAAPKDREIAWFTLKAKSFYRGEDTYLILLDN